MKQECLSCRSKTESDTIVSSPRCAVCGSPMMALRPPSGVEKPRIKLLSMAQCPHCWFGFPPERILWIAVSDDLTGDAVLGPDVYLRFSASRFNAAGIALDPKGNPCTQLACPRCHLAISPELLSIRPSFISLVGAPGSGKSFLLASMTHELRKLLPISFRLALNDIDADGNAPLLEYEKTLFHDGGAGNWVALRKTETQGQDLYREIMVEDQVQRLPRPLQFAVQPLDGAVAARTPPIAVVLYDNAGESFLPGADTFNSPVTRHVAHSRGVVFMVDPSKDARFRRKLKSDDPQLREGREVFRQDVMLGELAQRIRRLMNLAPLERHNQPLVVAVSKLDLWRGLLPSAPETPPVRYGPSSGRVSFDTELVERVSNEVRACLAENCPEIVAAAESNWTSVRYIPFSATGCSPAENPENGLLGLRPEDLSPVWAETPFLHFVNTWTDWLVPETENIKP